MEEMFYFSSLQILIKIRYNKTKNHMMYVSHKKLETNEREAIEGFVLKEFAPKTEYYTRPSVLEYAGIETELVKSLEQFRFHGIIRDVLKHKLLIDTKVRELIGHSLTNYYFEKVGEQILSIRMLYKESSDHDKLYNEIQKLEALLKAYNTNAEQDVELESIIPSKVLEFYLNYNKNQYN